MSTTPFDHYWLAVMNLAGESDSKIDRPIKEIAERAYNAGRKHEINRQKAINDIHKILNQE